MTDRFTYSDELLGDLHKDARGFRPGEGFWRQWRASSPWDRQQLWDALKAEQARSEALEADSRSRAVAGFEDLVTQIVDIVHGFDRTDVVRCLHDAYGTMGDDEHLEYRLGLPYGYIRRNA